MKFEGPYYPPIKKFEVDEQKSWKDRFHDLEAHHVKETQMMMEEIRRLESLVNSMISDQLDRRYSGE